MSDWKPIVGLSFTRDGLDSYCHSLQWNAWRPSFIVLHNTSDPSLAACPAGLTSQNIQGLVSYYRDKMHWSAGPHLFVDDHQIWVFTPLTMSGVHSPSWNKLSLGIEMLGDYDRELFSSGRGLQVRQNAVAAMATLCAVLGLDPSNPSMIRLHKEDPLTTHKFCPGKNVVKQDILQEVSDLLIARHGGEHTVAGPGVAPAAPAGDAAATNPVAGNG